MAHIPQELLYGGAQALTSPKTGQVQETFLQKELGQVRPGWAAQLACPNDHSLSGASTAQITFKSTDARHGHLGFWETSTNQLLLMWPILYQALPNEFVAKVIPLLSEPAMAPSLEQKAADFTAEVPILPSNSSDQRGLPHLRRCGRHARRDRHVHRDATVRRLQH